MARRAKSCGVKLNGKTFASHSAPSWKSGYFPNSYFVKIYIQWNALDEILEFLFISLEEYQWSGEAVRRLIDTRLDVLRGNTLYDR